MVLVHIIPNQREGEGIKGEGEGGRDREEGGKEQGRERRHIREGGREGETDVEWEREEGEREKEREEERGVRVRPKPLSLTVRLWLEMLVRGRMASIEDVGIVLY